MFQVSVIIPVYNVAHYIEEAVQSALIQPEVAEIILVEDGSKDNSLEVCEKLSCEFDKVRLLTHQYGKNMGASESRNLGIRSAQFDFVAFLDADDWYLPNRFTKESLLFENPEIMAVYSLSAIKFPDGRLEFFGCKDDLIDILKSKDVHKFYCHMMKNDIVLGNTNSNTFRKTVFESVGFFDERLELHQDSELWYRIARDFLFWPGELKTPVSVARRHDNNRITRKSKKSVFKMLYVWIDNIGINNLYSCEKEHLIYYVSRTISNPIKPKLLRKIVFHSSMTFLGLFRETVIRYFYKLNHNLK